MRPIPQFALGLALGAAASLAISVALLVLAFAFVLLVAVAAWLRSLVVLAGGLLAVGAIWLTLALTGQRRCDQMAGDCLEANFAPFLMISVLLVIAGVATTGLAWWLNRRRSAAIP